MMGTLATVLASRTIPTHTDRFVASVEGDIEDVDGILRITKIRVGTISQCRQKSDGSARGFCRL